MKTVAQLTLMVLMLTTNATYAEDFSGKCGGMEKIGPSELNGIPLEKIGCNGISGALAKKLGTLPNRAVIFHYKSASGQLATLEIHDFRKDPENVALTSIKSSVIGSDSSIKNSRKSIENSVKNGSLGAKQALKKIDAAKRVVSLLATDDGFVSFLDRASPRGSLTAVVFDNILLSASYPSSNIDDAVNKANALFKAIHLNLLNSTDPL
jgi:hypothetical protein